MFRNLMIVATAAIVASSTGLALAQDTTEAVDSPARGRIGLLEQRLSDLEILAANLATALGAAEANIGLLTGRLNTAEDNIASLQAELDATQGDSIFSLSSCVTVDTVFRDIDRDGVDDALPRVLVEGCNLQIVDGTGQTVPDTLGPTNGLGNLIVGYDEEIPDLANLAFLKRCSSGLYDNQADCEAHNQVWALNHKNGSHNLVVGPRNRYSNRGGVVFGLDNTVNNVLATVTGGDQNTASGNLSSVNGGFENTAGGQFSSVSGGIGNTASEYSSSISGGHYNQASAMYSSVSGGRSNKATGQFSSVSGGWGNTASGEHASVSGGYLRTAPGEKDWAAGSLWEDE